MARDRSTPKEKIEPSDQRRNEERVSGAVCAREPAGEIVAPDAVANSQRVRRPNRLQHSSVRHDTLASKPSVVSAAATICPVAQPARAAIAQMMQRCATKSPITSNFVATRLGFHRGSRQVTGHRIEYAGYEVERRRRHAERVSGPRDDVGAPQAE